MELKNKFITQKPVYLSHLLVWLRKSYASRMMAESMTASRKALSSLCSALVGTSSLFTFLEGIRDRNISTVLIFGFKYKYGASLLKRLVVRITLS